MFICLSAVVTTILVRDSVLNLFERVSAKKEPVVKDLLMACCFFFRSEARSGALGGANSPLSEQRRLLPSDNTQILFHVERGVCKRHRES